MSKNDPSIYIPEGLSIGYSSRFRRKNPVALLATAESPIELGDGRHLLLARNGRGKTTMEMAERIELDADKAYGKLSKGNRQKVGLIVAEARTFHNGPQVLLLDEPFSGLDFSARDKVDQIWSENEEGIVRLVCVHPDEPTLKADSAVTIREGRLEKLEVVNGTLDWMETRLSLN
ncbi:MAG: hypothetical protein ABL994_20100 [Verrucomicrobiales bacterium]